MQYSYIVPIYIVSWVKQIKPLTSSLQILQVAGTVGHWIVLSTIDSANHEVKIYDSLYNSIYEDTLTVIAALLKVNMFPHKHAHNAHGQTIW